MNKHLAKLLSEHSDGQTLYGDNEGSVIFKNGSAIETIPSNESVRGTGFFTTSEFTEENFHEMCEKVKNISTPRIVPMCMTREFWINNKDVFLTFYTEEDYQDMVKDMYKESGK